jgi:hypothetical protein
MFYFRYEFPNEPDMNCPGILRIISHKTGVHNQTHDMYLQKYKKCKTETLIL